MRNHPLRTLALFTLAAVVAGGCSPSTSQDAEVGDAIDNAIPINDDAPNAEEAGLPFEAFTPCEMASSYVAGNTVTFDNTQTYTPACITVHAGELVTFNGSFVEHPLRASTRGTSNTPIVDTSTGTTAEFRFNDIGFFPYYCLLHGADQGAGMSGVVQVIP